VSVFVCVCVCECVCVMECSAYLTKRACVCECACVCETTHFLSHQFETAHITPRTPIQGCMT
jgi:hypothetical protein